ncbi:cysteine--tRNA ligase [Asticcacaulis sp. BYS171W]|uniref:Cysteine--tRNA ligase n=1 Tax=Asticcacaulis aquaticus TaxID=2984212 RepID=A0ABT5HQU3_9CAUL|nr:cysteine--tRNA ligase [Asticcacaulis aquaticus]MDC7682428.1 cysteine--tRNA ligase [Asticcacaulis aquaticus]
MKLKINDTLKREKTEFVPKNPERVTMYVCGPTVYNYAHIGNARPVVVFDVLFRLLRALYGEQHVVYARNITDVDDKINQKAIAEGVDIDIITSKFADIYNADMKALGALEPTLQPRVTQNMNAIVAQIAALVRNGHAYAAEGHVLFDVESYKAYGSLSNRSLDDMIAGARVEVAPYKKNPQDFVLWKPSKPGEPRWPSPWGEGRPGWHIECSAMIEANLGLPIDIHGGGHDLVFPHHENEIAQGVCAQHGHSHNEETYARYWMHNGFLTMDSEKMSKSIGNVQLVHELIKHFPGEVLRVALLSAHYRAPLDWTQDLLTQTHKRLDGLYGALRRAADVEQVEAGVPDAVLEALCDDLSTPRALAELSVLANALETAEAADKPRLKAQLLAAGALLGVLQGDADAWFKAGADDDLTAKVEALLVARKEARAAKNWAEADRIRDELNALNVEVMDGPTGATWKVKTGA